uniref:Nad-binding rossmann-fold superfamily protein isoform 1 n=1 Tax=Tetraselmis sp. GSL018 TaxID=582737 RepID=A0A061RMZ7_9CHLO
MFDADTEEAHLGGGPDFVLDAIDNIDTKVALLAACHRRGIPVLCVGGAGARLDPTRLRFADISETSVDPLARSVRSRLRKDHGIKSGVTVLLSVEKPTCKLLPIDQVAAPGQDPLDFQVVPNFRVRTIPVLGTLPAMFGMAAATFLLARLAGRDLDPDSPVSLTRAQYERQLTRLEDRERERFGSDDGVAVDIDEIVYLVRELWRGFSARAPRVVLPGGDKGLCRSTSELVLTRWDSRRPATVDNLVLLTREEADTHDSTDLETIRSAEPEFYRDVSLSLQRARHDFCCRHDQCLLQESSCAPLATA